MRSLSLFLAAPVSVLVLSSGAAAQIAWTQRNPGISPPARGSHSLANDPSSGQVLLFGGIDTAGLQLADTWLWNGANWTNLAPASGPPARSSSALAHDGQGFLLFGGLSGTANLADTWRFDGTQWTQLSPAQAPPARSAHAMVRTARGVLLFGAGADTWLWNGAIWIQQSPATSPPPQSYPLLAYDSHRDRAVSVSWANGDTWEWDGVTWLQRAPALQPRYSYRARMAYHPHRRRTVLFGGQQESATWEWDGQDWRWLGSLGPSARWAHAMAFDSRQRIVLFGGRANAPRALGDTWTFDQPAHFSTYGVGCPGAAGVPTLRALQGQQPWPGSTFTLELTSLPAVGSAIGVLGFSNSHWGTLPLPASLTSLGLTGCTAYVSPDHAVFLAIAAGRATWPLALPNNAALVGQEFHVQGVVPDPTANPAGLIVSNAGEGRIADAVVTVIESFDDDLQLDREVSSGAWGSGAVQFGAIGGDGVHGEFTPSLGTFVGTVGLHDEYLFDTDNTIIPGDRTRYGQPVAVTDGRYYFTRMVVPADVRLRFVGSNPPVFNVRGELSVLGEIVVDAGDVPRWNATYQLNGQPGGPGGVFGGRGGQGADRADGRGPDPRFDGRDGDPVQLMAGHAYAGRAMVTGGPGSPLFPAHGLNGSLVYTSFFCQEAAAGGGGGGSFAAGGGGSVVVNLFNGTQQPNGAPVPGGAAFDPFPLPPGVSGTDHFLIGGGGGGGGGSHPLFAISFTPTWASGGGGAGGGGAVALRAGYLLHVDQGALISARGGSGSVYLGNDLARVPAPGGGGSGGAIVLQAGGPSTIDGTLDVMPGFGTEVDKRPVNRQVQLAGGRGAPGWIRFETGLNGPHPRSLPRAIPPAIAANVGPLLDRDPVVGLQSKWYATGVSRAPQYLRYEVTARVGSGTVVYSDDPTVGVLARLGSQPVALFVQAADLDPNTGEPEPTTIGPWRLYAGDFGATLGQPGLVDDGGNAFRFQILHDRSFGQTVTIEEVRVFFR